MLPAALLAKKRDGEALSDREIRFLIEGFCEGKVADYQMSALAMAICIRDMNSREIRTLTSAMVDSGERLPRVTDRPRVDKHSTGGLGDKVSLILAPLLASLDVDVPMVSGRGLGLTGGTLDKLEAIEGFQTQLSLDESSRVLRKVGAFIIGASERIAPADRRLYALRDVTGTVESIPLITASILSKKLAARLDALVMDVKVGSGAFMKTLARANLLASSIIDVGCHSNLPTTAILSDMDQPLGQAIGNAIEVNESIEVLQGNGPPEVRELTIQLCADLLVAVDKAKNHDEARRNLNRQLDSGAGYERFIQMVHMQGGSIGEPLSLAPSETLCAKTEGWVDLIDCQSIGEAIVEMGGGRKRSDDRIDPSVGAKIHVRIGDHVTVDQPLLTLHCPSPIRSEFVQRLRGVVRLTESLTSARPIVLQRLGQDETKNAC
ncbi:Pyrimidine-nucleoside phosphorylase [Planctomycetes bacterium CA13]|uniref:thymidine phosphorylase n=1 Tax=Novipirellula herctigrandis TaxID=2527986 RepID=A0A5C5YY56_9BACT|nr:Pyrimidine-nucleoside phosphorylase [Planctomycetes bacterium CA13]